MSCNGFAVLVLASTLTLSGCSSSSSSPTSPDASSPAALSVLPAASSTGVSVSTPIVITFSMAMMSGSEMLVVVHEGSVTGKQVTGTSSWSTDRRVLTITPAAPLNPKTTYIVHLSPSLQEMNGSAIDLAQCTSIGGQYVSGGMMSAGMTGMMNGTWGPGMMGAGWQAADGTFGMVFSFTTA